MNSELQPDPGSFRASDADRELVTNLLTSAYADGRLTRDELDARVDAAMSARTFAELTPLTADLLPARQQVQYVSHPQATSSIVRPTGDPSIETILSLLSSTRRQGPWRLHRSSTALAIMGSIKLDLRQASFEAANCELNVTCIMGSVKVVVPQGVEVIDKTVPIMGDHKTRGPHQPSPGAPTLTIRGLLLMSELDVDYRTS